MIALTIGNLIMPPIWAGIAAYAAWYIAKVRKHSQIALTEARAWKKASR